MKYITLNNMMDTIRRNFHKVPHDVDFVIGIPRSGIICASVISEFLNVPLIDVDSFVSGAKPTGGSRLRYNPKNKGISEEAKKKVLVVDDTIFNGMSNRKTREKLKPFVDSHDFIYLVVYLEGRANNAVNIHLEDVRKYTDGFKQPVLYEWNIFHHNPSFMSCCIYDIDGVLCVDPPDERNTQAYEEYIKNAIPLFTPASTIGKLMTYRLIKYEDVTRQWLKEHDISYGNLIMFNAQSWDERNNSGITPELMKGEYYKNDETAKLFVESDDWQARRIYERSGKPVYCVSSNIMYGNEK